MGIAGKTNVCRGTPGAKWHTPYSFSVQLDVSKVVGYLCRVSNSEFQFLSCLAHCVFLLTSANPFRRISWPSCARWSSRSYKRSANLCCIHTYSVHHDFWCWTSLLYYVITLSILANQTPSNVINPQSPHISHLHVSSFILADCRGLVAAADGAAPPSGSNVHRDASRAPTSSTAVNIAEEGRIIKGDHELRHSGGRRPSSGTTTRRNVVRYDDNVVTRASTQEERGRTRLLKPPRQKDALASKRYKLDSGRDTEHLSRSDRDSAALQKTRLAPANKDSVETSPALPNYDPEQGGCGTVMSDNGTATFRYDVHTDLLLSPQDKRRERSNLRPFQDSAAVGGPFDEIPPLSSVLRDQAPHSQQKSSSLQQQVVDRVDGQQLRGKGASPHLDSGLSLGQQENRTFSDEGREMHREGGEAQELVPESLQEKRKWITLGDNDAPPFPLQDPPGQRLEGGSLQVQSVTRVSEVGKIPTSRPASPFKIITYLSEGTANRMSPFYSMEKRTSFEKFEAAQNALMGDLTTHLSRLWRRHWLQAIEALQQHPYEARRNALQVMVRQMDMALERVISLRPVRLSVRVNKWMRKMREIYIFVFTTGMRLGVASRNLHPVGPLADTAQDIPQESQEVVEVATGELHRILLLAPVTRKENARCIVRAQKQFWAQFQASLLPQVIEAKLVEAQVSLAKLLSLLDVKATSFEKTPKKNSTIKATETYASFNERSEDNKCSANDTNKGLGSLKRLTSEDESSAVHSRDNAHTSSNTKQISVVLTSPADVKLTEDREDVSSRRVSAPLNVPISDKSKRVATVNTLESKVEVYPRVRFPLTPDFLQTPVKSLERLPFKKFTTSFTPTSDNKARACILDGSLEVHRQHHILQKPTELGGNKEINETLRNASNQGSSLAVLENYDFKTYLPAELRGRSSKGTNTANYGRDVNRVGRADKRSAVSTGPNSGNTAKTSEIRSAGHVCEELLEPNKPSSSVADIPGGGDSTPGRRTKAKDDSSAAVVTSPLGMQLNRDAKMLQKVQHPAGTITRRNRLFDSDQCSGGTCNDKVAEIEAAKEASASKDKREKELTRTGTVVGSVQQRNATAIQRISTGSRNVSWPSSSGTILPTITPVDGTMQSARPGGETAKTNTNEVTGVSSVATGKRNSARKHAIISSDGHTPYALEDVAQPWNFSSLLPLPFKPERAPISAVAATSSITPSFKQEAERSVISSAGAGKHLSPTLGDTYSNRENVNNSDRATDTQPLVRKSDGSSNSNARERDCIDCSDVAVIYAGLRGRSDSSNRDDNSRIDNSDNYNNDTSREGSTTRSGKSPTDLNIKSIESDHFGTGNGHSSAEVRRVLSRDSGSHDIRRVDRRTSRARQGVSLKGENERRHKVQNSGTTRGETDMPPESGGAKEADNRPNSGNTSSSISPTKVHARKYGSGDTCINKNAAGNMDMEEHTNNKDSVGVPHNKQGTSFDHFPIESANTTRTLWARGRRRSHDNDRTISAAVSDGSWASGGSRSADGARRETSSCNIIKADGSGNAVYCITDESGGANSPLGENNTVTSGMAPWIRVASSDSSAATPFAELSTEVLAAESDKQTDDEEASLKTSDQPTQRQRVPQQLEQVPTFAGAPSLQQAAVSLGPDDVRRDQLHDSRQPGTDNSIHSNSQKGIQQEAAILLGLNEKGQEETVSLRQRHARRERMAQKPKQGRSMLSTGAVKQQQASGDEPLGRKQFKTIRWGQDRVQLQSPLQLPAVLSRDPRLHMLRRKSTEREQQNRLRPHLQQQAQQQQQDAKISGQVDEPRKHRQSNLQSTKAQRMRAGAIYERAHRHIPLSQQPLRLAVHQLSAASAQHGRSRQAEEPCREDKQQKKILRDANKQQSPWHFVEQPHGQHTFGRKQQASCNPLHARQELHVSKKTSAGQQQPVEKGNVSRSQAHEWSTGTKAQLVPDRLQPPGKRKNIQPKKNVRASELRMATQQTHLNTESEVLPRTGKRHLSVASKIAPALESSEEKSAAGIEEIRLPFNEDVREETPRSVGVAKEKLTSTRDEDEAGVGTVPPADDRTEQSLLHKQLQSFLPPIRADAGVSGARLASRATFTPADVHGRSCVASDATKNGSLPDCDAGSRGRVTEDQKAHGFLEHLSQQQVVQRKDENAPQKRLQRTVQRRRVVQRPELQQQQPAQYKGKQKQEADQRLILYQNQDIHRHRTRRRNRDNNPAEAARRERRIQAGQRQHHQEMQHQTTPLQVGLGGRGKVSAEITPGTAGLSEAPEERRNKSAEAHGLP